MRGSLNLGTKSSVRLSLPKNLPNSSTHDASALSIAYLPSPHLFEPLTALSAACMWLVVGQSDSMIDPQSSLYLVIAGVTQYIDSNGRGLE